MRILKIVTAFVILIVSIMPSIVFADEEQVEQTPPIEEPSPPIEEPSPPIEEPNEPIVTEPTPPIEPPITTPPTVEEIPSVEETTPTETESYEEVEEEVVKTYTSCEITIDGNDFVYNGKTETRYTQNNAVCGELNIIGKYDGGERKGTFSITSKMYNGEVFDGQYISYETDTHIISVKVNTIMPKITTPLLEDFETTKTLIYRKIVKNKYNVEDMKKYLSDGRFDYIVKDNKYYAVIDGEVVQEVTKGQLIYLGLIQSEILRLERLQAERLEYERKVKKEAEEQAILLAEQKRQDRLKEIEREKRKANSVNYAKVQYVILIPTIVLIVLVILFVYTLVKSYRIQQSYAVLDTTYVDGNGNTVRIQPITNRITDILKKDRKLTKIYNKSKRMKTE